MAVRMNLNTADAEALVTLPGIGPALASRILSYRDAAGSIRSVDDLAVIAGLRPNIIDGLRGRVSFDQPAAAPALPPQELKVTITGGDVKDFASHRLFATFTRLESISANGEASLPVPSEIVNDLGVGLSPVLTLPAKGQMTGDLTLRVHAPDGEVLATATLDSAALPPATVINAAPKSYAKTSPNRDPNAGNPARLRGQVIDPTGRLRFGNIQVVIWAAEKASPAPVDFRALLVLQTDRAGYFSGPYPAGSFSEANAEIALGEHPVTAPIHLEQRTVPDLTAGAAANATTTIMAIPETAVLVIDPAKIPKGLTQEDLDSNTGDFALRDPDMTDLTRPGSGFSSDQGVGRCVDFTKPDRTLEEFTYSYVVRTTEPVIKGLTLDEPRKIDLTHLLDKIRATQASSLMMDGSLARTDDRPAETEFMGPAVAEQDDAAAGISRMITPEINAEILHTLTRDPDGFSLTSLATASRLSLHQDLTRLIGLHLGRQPGRSRLTCDSPVDWDDDPTIYQACTIAHGHILGFKQEWVADGYSMGTLLYSLPLAPGQKKQIAIVDWERRESSSRTESLEERESLEAKVGRDRDINEVVNGTINEDIRGHSDSSSGSFAGGLGVAGIFGPVGAVLGIGGGTASADSNSWQTSSRNTSATALNRLRDRTVQSASSVRNQRSTVIQTVRQGERVTATTESVANYNHCHALTIQYFEVLRHMLVRQRLTDVQECLFVPLLMSRFDASKALRWRNTLRPVVTDRRLRGGFDAADRISRNYAGMNFPTGAYADENIIYLEGDLRIRFELARPKDSNDVFEANAWNWLAKLFPSSTAAEFHKTYIEKQQQKDRIFLEQMGPRIASAFVQNMQFIAVDAAGARKNLPVDATLLTDFVNDRSLYVSLRMSGSIPALARKSIHHIEISDIAKLVNLPFFQILPADSRVIVESGTMRYRTDYSFDSIFRDATINNDLGGGDIVYIDTPLNRQELRKPREEDLELRRQLLDHLNENLEGYHHAIWWRMSPDRRFMLLDGFEAPNSQGRSVASVVQNQLIGIAGNSLILPVSPGQHLDPMFKQDAKNPIDLLEHYQPNTPVEPVRLALPTRGVYAEAVMGACNSCEFKEEERFWRWEESPIPDSPPAILPTSTDTRRAEPPDLTAKDFPAPIVAMQVSPAAPDPTGLGAALSLLGTPNLFRDATGLEGTQRNAAAALQGAFDTAQAFGKSASDLALQGKMNKDIDKSMRTIQTAQARGLISNEQAQSLTESAIRGMIGGGADKGKSTLSDQPEVKKLLDQTSKDKSGDSKVSLERSADGERETVDISRNAGSGGTAPAPVNTTIGKRSSKADALAQIAAAKASTKPSPWKLDRAKTFDRLQEIVIDPDKVDQDTLNLCGPAAFLRLWVARDPVAVVKFATELYDTGKSAIGSYKVEPDDDSLIAQDFAALQAANPGFKIKEADWMIMGSLRDAENFFFDFEGVPGEAVAAFTTPGELAEWFEATNLYSVVSDEGNFFFTKGIDHAITLKPGPTRDIALLINAHMLTQMNVTQGTKKADSFILNAFPNHFVVLTSDIKETNDNKVALSMWSWGQHFGGTIDKATFEANYYGAVMGEGANA